MMTLHPRTVAFAGGGGAESEASVNWLFVRFSN